MKPIHPLFQKIIERMIEQDIRDFQLPSQQRTMTALNYIHVDEGKVRMPRMPRPKF